MKMTKIFWIITISLGIALPLLADGTNSVLSNEKDRVSYAIGMMIGHNLQQQSLPINPEMLARAINDMQSGATPLLTLPEANEAIRSFQMAQVAKLKAEGEAFLATNKNNPGVVTLPDGLEYRVITEGMGATPVAGDTVTVNYRGTLVNGTEFDSSFKRGHPATFPVTGVIRGWTEALEKMKAGSKWELFIPSDLAYGPQGRPGIPPNSVLIFEVDLLSVESPRPPAPTSQAKPAANAPLTSDIIEVPSADALKKGAQIKVIKAEDVQKMQQQQQSTNN